MAERCTVDADVVGSSPISHPIVNNPASTNAACGVV